MKHTNDWKVWIGVEQRLDGLNSRGSDWPEPYITVDLQDGDDNVEFTVSLELAKKIAKGLNRAARRAQA